MQLEALLRSRDQEVSSLSHRSAVTALLVVSHTTCIAAWMWQLRCCTQTGGHSPVVSHSTCIAAWAWQLSYCAQIG